MTAAEMGIGGGMMTVRSVVKTTMAILVVVPSTIIQMVEIIAITKAVTYAKAHRIALVTTLNMRKEIATEAIESGSANVRLTVTDRTILVGIEIEDSV